jgi:hypothetical protein
MRHANYRVIDANSEQVILRDVGPWTEYPTVTNDAEWVVEQVAPMLSGRQLLYFDSMNSLSELRVRNGKFAGFAPYNA